jgi:FkbM family methyltransferase
MAIINKVKAIINFRRQEITSIIRKAGLQFTTDVNKIKHFGATYKCNKKWYGSSYGGFYLNPDKLTSNSIVYSFGIGKDLTFDQKVIQKHNCKVFGFDPTPKSIDYVGKLKISPLFYFSNFGISTSTGSEKFYLPRNKHAVSGSMAINEYMDQSNFIEVQMKNFKDIASGFGHEYIDVVKMDIEGSEYTVIETVINSGVPICQLLVEFHDRFFDTSEFKSKEVVKFLNNKGFEIFGVSLGYEEVSFINTNIAK